MIQEASMHTKMGPLLWIVGTTYFLVEISEPKADLGHLSLRVGVKVGAVYMGRDYLGTQEKWPVLIKTKECSVWRSHVTGRAVLLLGALPTVVTQDSKFLSSLMRRKEVQL
jgi:hypothetical protein